MSKSSPYNSAMSALGSALAGLEKFEEAEPLILEGYRKMNPPPERQKRGRDALERVVELYDAWGKPDKAAEWRAKLAEMEEEPGSE